MKAGPSGHFAGYIYAAEAVEADEATEDLGVNCTRWSSRADPGLFVWLRCEDESQTHFRRIHIYHTTAWCIGCRGEGAREYIINADGIVHMQYGRDSSVFQTYFYKLTTLGAIQTLRIDFLLQMAERCTTNGRLRRW